MATSHESLENANRNSNEQTPNKQVRRNHEDEAGFPHSTKIDQRNEYENSEAQDKRMRLQAGHRGNKSADTSGNPHGDHQNVVNHQSSGRKEPGRDAEILACDSVRSTATGVCLDRLTVGKINDGEQHDDAGADRNHVENSRRAERNEQRQGSLWTIGRGAEGIQ